MNIEIWSVTRINITRETFFMYIERGVETTPTHPLSCRPLKGHSKSMFVEEYRVGGTLKNEQKQTGGWGRGLACVYVRFWKKNIKSFMVILQFFLLIIMAVWNITQTIMKGYNTIIIFSPVNEWSAIAFARLNKITNVGYIKNIYLQPVVGWIST